jgi:hypothetical protein
MKNNKAKILIIFFIVSVVGAYFYHNWYYDDLYQKPQKYPYQTYYGVPNNILLIEDLKYRDSLIKYYTEMERGNENPIFNFPLKDLPYCKPVFIVGYSDDSILTEFVSLYDRGRSVGGSFTNGWVLSKLLHNDKLSKCK